LWPLRSLELHRACRLAGRGVCRIDGRRQLIVPALGSGNALTLGN